MCRVHFFLCETNLDIERSLVTSTGRVSSCPLDLQLCLVLSNVHPFHLYQHRRSLACELRAGVSFACKWNQQRQLQASFDLYHRVVGFFFACTIPISHETSDTIEKKRGLSF